jgi:hypothetical protein
MNLHRICCSLAATILALGLTSAGLPDQEAAVAPKPQPAAALQIEVCFVLDTTGSMGGLIAGAKAKIWSIANQLIAAKPTPKLKIALVAYRDRGDGYITLVFDLTEDIDAVYSNLQKFVAGGGGDEPESVNQALHEAVTKITWSPDREVLKIVFLVGDSPPHMNYGDDVKYPDVCQFAMQKDLIINTVQCGSNPRTTPIWQEIAQRSEGKFVAISQTGDMQVVSTPVDQDLAELNVALGATLVPYGHDEQRRLVAAKQAASEAAAAPAAADRLAYNVALGRGVQGVGDLVDDLKDGKATLATLKKEELPADMQAMTVEQQRDFLQQKAEKRQQLQARVHELLKQRQAFINTELQRRLQAGKGNAFDVQVARIIRDQARRKGIEYGDVAPPQSKQAGGEGR